MSKNIKKIFKYIVYLLASIGLVFTLVFFAIQLGLLNVRGGASQRSSYFNTSGNGQLPILEQTADIQALCEINVLHKYAPVTSINIYKTLRNGSDLFIINKMISTASERFKEDRFFVDDMEHCLENPYKNNSVSLPNTAYHWADSD